VESRKGAEPGPTGAGGFPVLEAAGALLILVQLGDRVQCILQMSRKPQMGSPEHGFLRYLCDQPGIATDWYSFLVDEKCCISGCLILGAQSRSPDPSRSRSRALRLGQLVCMSF